MCFVKSNRVEDLEGKKQRLFDHSLRKKKICGKFSNKNVEENFTPFHVQFTVFLDFKALVANENAQSI